MIGRTSNDTRLLPLLLLLYGCAPTGPLPAPSSDDGLARELAGRVAGPAQSCVPVSVSARALQIADRRAIVYREGGTIWVNRLSDDCPGFHPSDTLVVEIYGGRYCRGDRVYVRSPGSNIPGPACLLGEFVPYRRP